MDEEKLDLDQEFGDLSHEDLCEITESSVRRLIAADPLLQDLPGDVTTEEVLSQIAVAQGKSITVVVLRHFETPLSVVVSGNVRLCYKFNFERISLNSCFGSQSGVKLQVCVLFHSPRYVLLR